MVLTLHGDPTSTATQRAAVVLHEKQVPFKFVSVDWAQVKSPEHRKKQPFGQLPFLDDDGYIIYESRAIGRYVAEKYADQGTPLIPTEIKAKGIFEQAASVEQANFDSYAVKVIVELLYKGAPPDKEYVASVLQTLGAKLDVYDAILSKQKYVAGDEITLADLFHLPFGVQLGEIGVTVLTERPNVARWLKDLTERPSWKAITGEGGITATDLN